MTRPVEQFVRDAPAPADDVVAVRGGPLTVEKLLTQAEDEARRHTWRGQPMAAVSVFCTVDGWTIEAILAAQLATRSTYAAVQLGTLRQAVFDVIATYGSPHFDLVMTEASAEAAGTLLALLGPPERNGYRRRR